MPSGQTYTDALQDSLPTVIAAARQVGEFAGVMSQVVDQATLGEGTGLTYHEVSYAKLTAQAVSESTLLENAQQLSDTDFPVTPTVVGLLTLISDRVAARISKNAFAQTGSLAQHGIVRKVDIDGLTTLDSLTNELGGAGTTITSGHVSAAIASIQVGGASEPGMPPYNWVAHPYHVKDVQDEIVAGVGTYALPEGLTARVFTEGFAGMLFGARVFPDGNMPVITGDDAKGGVFATRCILKVQGRSPRVAVIRNEKLGGGATEQVHYDEFAYGIRQQSWGSELQGDAAAQTS